MTDFQFVLNFLKREYTDNNTMMYLNICGNVRSAQRVRDQIFSDLHNIFNPVIPESEVRKAIEVFLEDIKVKYKNGELSIKPFY